MSTLATAALEAYEAMAPTYDRFTADYDHQTLLGRIEALALEHGLPGRRVLDVACGTGKSAEPLSARGYDVSACDLSPSMADRARERLGPAVDVFVADMRALPADAGPVDLVVCLDDAVNHLADAEDLAAAFASVSDVLAPGGLYVFDVNTLAAYRSPWAQQSVSEADGAFFAWRAEQEDVEADGPYRARLDTFVADGAGGWERRTIRHEQRHFSDGVVRECLDAAGLELVDLLGHVPGAALRRPADEERHLKRLYVARR